jgi:hypothetical protein
MRRRKKDGKVSTPRTHLKKQKQTKKHKAIEREYQQVFTPRTLPSHGAYTDEDSLEQPSALKYVDSTTIPANEVLCS